MKSSRKRFHFELIEGFDARRGYKRCTLPGVIVQVNGHVPSSANADLWRDKKGNLVVRFSGRGDRYHFLVVLASGKKVPEHDIDELGDYVGEALHEWVCDGMGDVPESVL